MPRTDQEIYEYMSYYNTTSYRKWAFENLCRVECKTPEEIKGICKMEGEKVKKYSDSVRNAVICDRLKGIPASKTAAEQGLTTKQVENIFTMYKQKQNAETNTREAIEHAVADVKWERFETADNPPQIAEKIPYKKPEIIKPPTRDGFWYAIANEFRNFAETTLGAGISVQGIQADEHKHFASLTVKTADGETVVFMATTKN